MTRILKTILFASVLLVTGVYGSGKGVTLATAEVINVEEEYYSGYYLGLGLLAAKFHSCGNDCDYEDETYGAMLRVGHDYNENLGTEIRIMRTFLDEGPFGGVPLQHIGIFAKPQYALGEDFNLYGLLGYGYTENLGNGARLDYFDNDHGFTAGIGVEYDLSDRQGDLLENVTYDREFDGHADQGLGWSLFLDYQRLLIKSDIPDLDAVSFGLRYDF